MELCRMVGLFGWLVKKTCTAWSSEFNSIGLALIQATNLITKKELLTTDPDTDDKQLIYEITDGPRNGYVENKLKPGTTVTMFSQGMEDGLCVVAFFPSAASICQNSLYMGGKNGGRGEDEG